MVIKIYSFLISPPARFVLLTLEALELEYEVISVNFLKGENKQPEYLAINPRGKVPALQDDEYTICESAAIACYLCNKYEKATERQLYPTDPQAKGKVDRLLYVSQDIFDAALTYMNIFRVLSGDGVTNEAKHDEFMKEIGLIETCLGDKDYLAADHLTLAGIAQCDFFISTTIINVESALSLSLVDFPKALAWLDRIKALPYFSKTHDEGVAMFGKFYKECLAKNQSKASQ